MMDRWMLCEDCGEVVEAERTHNGICPCLHYIHCGWGHSAGLSEGYSTREEAEQERVRRLDTHVSDMMMED